MLVRYRTLNKSAIMFGEDCVKTDVLSNLLQFILELSFDLKRTEIVLH